MKTMGELVDGLAMSATSFGMANRNSPAEKNARDRVMNAKADILAEHDRRVTELLAANNVEVERRRIAEARVLELETPLEHVARLLQACDPFGPLHIVVGDCNLEDRHLAWCEANGRLNETEQRCVAALRALSLGNRYLAYEIMEGLPE